MPERNGNTLRLNILWAAFAFAVTGAAGFFANRYITEQDEKDKDLSTQSQVVRAQLVEMKQELTVIRVQHEEMILRLGRMESKLERVR